MNAAGTTVNPPRSSKEENTVRESELLSALPARSAGREVKIGIFVLLGIVAFMTALFTLTDVGTFRGRYYATTIVESAGGLRPGDAVQMRGVNIGRVTDFEMVPDGVAVTMEIYNRFFVPEDSRVVMRSGGLLGGMVVDVVPGTSEDRVEDDQIMPGSVEADLLSSAGGLGGQAEEVLARANLLLSRETIGNVGTSMAELQGLIVELSALAAQQRTELAALTQSLRASAAGVEQATSGPELESAVQNVQALTARLDAASADLANASTALSTVLERVERGEGTLGRLTVDESLYDNMNEAAASIRDLVTDIRQNPRRYFDVRVF